MPNYIPGFDPVAMGLKPIVQGGYTPASAETGEATDPGEQTGWYKYLGDRKQQQYDMDGNPTRVFENPGMGEQTLDLGKKLAPLALAALGANAFGGLATGVGDAGAGMGWMGGAGGSDALFTSAELFAPAATTVAEAATIAAPAASTIGSAGATGAATTAADVGAAGWMDGVTTAWNGVGVTPAMVAAKPGVVEWFTSTFGKEGLGGWIKENAELSKLLFSAVGGAVSAYGANNTADKNNQNKIDQINLTQQHKLDDNKRYSDSVKGLKSGLINSAQQPLRRLGGAQVFGSNGLINRG